MSFKYLDDSGLLYFWTKLKILLAGKAAPGLFIAGLTLPTSGYSGSGPYTIDITATGVTTGASKVYDIRPVLSDTDATRELEQTAWDLIVDIKYPSADTLRLKLSAVPATAVSFILKEVP